MISPYVYGFGNVIKPDPGKIHSCDGVDECHSVITNETTASELTPIKRFAVMHFHHHGNASHVIRMNNIKRLKMCQNLYY